MARLPVVGGDRDNWGQVLNEYLSVEHNSDGSLKLRTDGSLSNNIADGSVTASKLSASVNSYLASAQTAVQSVNGKTGQAVTLTASDVSAVSTSAAGAASGVATLDGSSTLTAAQIPSSVTLRTNSRTRYLREYGVTGTTGDTARINAALVESASQGFLLLGDPGLTIPVESAGTKNFCNPTGSVIASRPYGIEIPSGARIDWRGAKLQGSTLNMVLLSNKTTNATATGTASSNGSYTLSSVTGTGWAVGQYVSDSAGTALQSDTQITAVGSGTLTLSRLPKTSGAITISAVAASDTIECHNLVVDGGDTVGNWTLPMIWFYGLLNSKVTGITAQNCSYVAAQVSACEYCQFDNLHVQNVRGQGWCMGGNLADQIRHCDLGNISGELINDFGGFSQPGNPICIGGVDLTFESLRGRNCSAGHKILPFSSDIRGVLSHFDGAPAPGETDYGILGDNQNSGTKIQGTDVSDRLSVIMIQSVVSRNCSGPGLYVRAVDSLQIGGYDGFKNGRDGVTNDIDIDGVGVLEMSATSRRAGGAAVAFGNSMGTVRGSIVIHDAGEVTAGATTAMYLGAAIKGNLDRLEILDGTTGTATTTNGSPTLTAVVVQPTAGSGLGFQTGMLISGTGIPASTYVGMVTANTVGLVDASGNPVNATASGSSVAISTQRAIKAIDGSSPVTFEVASYRCNASNCLDIRSDRIRLGSPILSGGSNALHGLVTLAAGTTQTNIAQQNIRSAAISGGGYVEPLVVITPMNSAAVALGVPRYTIPATFQLRLHHASAVGTEVFAYRILEYSYRSTQFA